MTHPGQECWSTFSAQSPFSLDLMGSRLTAMPIPGAKADGFSSVRSLPGINHDPGAEGEVALALSRPPEQRVVDHNLPSIKPGLAALRGRSSDLGHTREFVGTVVDHGPARAKGSHSPVPLKTIATRICIPNSSGGSPSVSGINQRLQGESPLSQANHTQSSNAYDKSLLNKIGKAPGHARRSSSETDTLTRTLSNSTRATPSPLRSGNNASSVVECHYKWATSPTATTFSTHESTGLNWSDHILPSATSTDAMSQRDRAYSIRIRNVQTRPSDTLLSTTHLQPSSQGQSFDSPSSDREHCWTDTDLGSGRISDRPRHSGTQGFKRRALLPSLDTTHQKSCSLSRAGPELLLQSTHSYSSDLGPTETSLYTPYSRGQNLSPGYLSFDPRPPRDDTRDRRAAGATDHSQARLSSSASQPRSEHLAAVIMSMPAINRTLPSSHLPIQFICTCCPKKPRKFDTEDKLRQHESEKQYTCAYCNNRFKNKNEAERHQNSLHLRKHSWSCSAISSPQAAFHSSNGNGSSSSHDTCGFCGQEFPNTEIDWSDRFAHLASEHRFGECNLSKKFYRADHFRQHLKHSHGGKSGKWTNVLEANCLREESISDSTSHSPTPSEHGSASGGGGGGSHAATKASTSTSSAAAMVPEVAETPIDEGLGKNG